MAVDVIHALSYPGLPDGFWVLVCTTHVGGSQLPLTKKLNDKLRCAKYVVGVDFVSIHGSNLAPLGFGSKHIVNSKKILVSPSVFLRLLATKGVDASAALFDSLNACEVRRQ